MTITADTDRSAALAAALGLQPDPQRQARTGSRRSWRGSGDSDSFTDTARDSILYLIYDYGVWPHHCYWVGLGAGDTGVVATYIEGDIYLDEFDDGAAAITFVETDAASAS